MRNPVNSRGFSLSRGRIIATFAILFVDEYIYIRCKEATNGK